MLFWLIILSISLALVIGVAGPLMSILRSPSVQSGGGKLSASRIIAFGALAAAPVAALAIYLDVGAPRSLDPFFREQAAAQSANPAAAISAMPVNERRAVIQGMVEGLARRLQENPDDFEGWRMLARSYGVLGRAEDSAGAYRQLIARDVNASAEDWRNYATALLEARGPDAEGYSNEFLETLDKIRTFNQSDPLALFYLGIVAHDEGNASGALDYWLQLKAVLPEDAPILPQLQSLIEEAEGAAQ
jgi:cytochrome c-type biogenesis protein CcmH